MGEAMSGEQVGPKRTGPVTGRSVPTTPDRVRDVWQWAVAVVTGLAIVVAWLPSYYEIWRTRWFPVWGATNLPLWERLTNGESYYTHGPLVPLICLTIAIYIHRRVGLPAQRSVSATAAGWAVLLVSVLLHLIGGYFRVKFLSGFCLISAVSGVVLLAGGWPLLRAYAVPIVFLIFMVPLPMSTIAMLNLQLKFLASEAGVWLTRHIFGVPAVLDGSFVHLLPDESGVSKTLIVENVCGGLRSLIALMFFASLFAVVCRVKGFWRPVMLALAAPVAVACNIVRITALNVVAHHYGTDAVAEGAWFHDLSGLFVFALALAILFGIEAGIIHVGRYFQRDWTDDRLLPFLARLPRGGQPRWLIAPAVVLSLTAALSLHAAQTPMEVNISDTARHAVPEMITLNGESFVGQDFELDEQTLMILQTNDYLYRRYTSASLPRGFELLIVFSSNIRNGAHAPEVCLEGAGQQIVGNRACVYDVPGIGALTMRELVTQQNTDLALHAYVFQCGESYTTSYIVQQSTIFWNGVRGGSTAGGLIRFSVAIENRDEEASRRVLEEAIAALMPHLKSTLK